MWRRMTYVFIAFSHVEIKNWIEANESWSKNKLTASALIKANVSFARPFRAAWQIPSELHSLYHCWSYWIFILLHLGSITKNIAVSVLHLFQVQQVQINVQNLIYFAFHFFKALYKQNLLVYQKNGTQD